MSTSKPQTTTAVAVSVVAGQPPHFRVQYQPSAASEWRHYANFRQSELARKCVLRLSERGVVARMVRFNIAPAAG